MANYEATRYDFDAANVTGIQGINTGLIIPWSAASIPSGFLECDGTAVSRTTYASLFAVIGTTFGVGDGSTTFNLPDLDDKVVKGRSPTANLGTATNANTVTATGNIGGSVDNATVPINLMAPHSHSPGFGPEFRGEGSASSGGGFYNYQEGASDSAGGDGAHTHNSSLTFTGDSGTVVQPHLITTYIIKT